MTTLTFPTLSGPTTWTWKKMNNTQTFASPLTQSVQTGVLPGARWACTATFENLQAADAASLRTFLARLQGTAGRFYMGNQPHRTIRGTGAGTPLVKGAAQTGYSLITDGWTVGTTVLAGDFIGFNGGAELRMVVTDATANGSGEITLAFDEPIRTSPNDNSAIVINDPTCIMRLVSDDLQIVYNAGGFASFTLDAVETFV